jgi:hypothetical protein
MLGEKGSFPSSQEGSLRGQPEVPKQNWLGGSEHDVSKFDVTYIYIYTHSSEEELKEIMGTSDEGVIRRGHELYLST